MENAGLKQAQRQAEIPMGKFCHRTGEKSQDVVLFCSVNYCQRGIMRVTVVQKREECVCEYVCVFVCVHTCKCKNWQVVCRDTSKKKGVQFISTETQSGEFQKYIAKIYLKYYSVCF